MWQLSELSLDITLTVLAHELELYTKGDPNYDKRDIEVTTLALYEGVPRANGSYFKESAGGIPDVVYFQGGAWDRAMGCLARGGYGEYTNVIAAVLAEAAPDSQLILATLPSGPAYPADPRAEMKRLADHQTEEKQKEKVVQCLKFLHSDTPGESSEEHMLKHLESRGLHKNAWIFDRGVTMEALPRDLFEFESWQDTSMRRLHPSMIANVWDIHRLVTALSTALPSLDVRCHASSHMQVNNPETCSPNTVMEKGDSLWPLGYPVKGRLQHWAVPCDFDVFVQD